MAFDFGSILAYRGLLWQGVVITLWLTAAATLLGVAIGILGAVGRTSGGRLPEVLVGAYVEFVRNTPFLVQLFFIFFGLPSLGLRLTALQAALLAITLNLGAYATEIIRAGIQAVPKGQTEAGLSLGLSQGAVFRHVVLWQALANIYPALTSQIILIMLGSAVVSQISAPELTFAANFIQSRTFRSFEVYLVITVLYFALTFLGRSLFAFIGLRAFRFQHVEGR